MLDKCSHTECLPFVSLICDHIDLLGFMDEDRVLLHPHSLCFTYLDCLCQTPTIHIMLISFTSSSETPMRLLSLPLKTSPQASLATALSLGCVLECPGDP